MSKVEILGIPIDRVTLPEALDRALSFLDQPQPHLIFTPNAEIMVKAQDDRELRQALLGADLVVPDGAGLIWASQYLDDPLPVRVAGIDLALSLLREVSKREIGVFFLGARPEVLPETIRALEETIPGLKIVGSYHGFFTPQEEEQVIEAILKASPEILMVGMGAPRQEKWLWKWAEHLPFRLAIGVGGAFDIWSGRSKRAPYWIRQRGLEWLYRLVLEPWRYKRMMALPRFVHLVLRQGKER